MKETGLSHSQSNLDQVSVVIPIVADHHHLETLLEDLSCASFGEIIVVCGDDSEYEIRDDMPIEFIRTRRGRGHQVGQALNQASRPWVWVLFADTRVSAKAIACLESHLDTATWGAFKVKLASTRPILKLVGLLMNWRSRLTSIYTGDQAIFARRELVDRVGGYPRIPLMEDIELSRRLKRQARAIQLNALVRTSARKWDREGALITIFRMWWYRLRYFLGANPEKLAFKYYRRKHVH